MKIELNCDKENMIILSTKEDENFQKKILSNLNYKF